MSAAHNPLFSKKPLFSELIARIFPSMRNVSKWNFRHGSELVFIYGIIERAISCSLLEEKQPCLLGAWTMNSHALSSTKPEAKWLHSSASETKKNDNIAKSACQSYKRWNAYLRSCNWILDVPGFVAILLMISAFFLFCASSRSLRHFSCIQSSSWNDSNQEKILCSVRKSGGVVRWLTNF